MLCLLLTHIENCGQSDWEKDDAMDRNQISKRSKLGIEVNKFAGHIEVPNLHLIINA